MTNSNLEKITTLREETPAYTLDQVGEIPESHSVLHSILLHLLPGIMISAVVFGIRGSIRVAGYPTLMALIVAIPVALIPVELGILYFHGWERNGRLSLEGIALYRDRMPTWKYFVVAPSVAFLAFTVLVLFQPWDSFLHQAAFSWIPPLDSGMEGGFSKSTLLVTYTFAILFGAFLGPITEELYFAAACFPACTTLGDGQSSYIPCSSVCIISSQSGSLSPARS